VPVPPSLFCGEFLDNVTMPAEDLDNGQAAGWGKAVFEVFEVVPTDFGLKTR
jgi:hypothetical protein